MGVIETNINVSFIGQIEYLSGKQGNECNHPGWKLRFLVPYSDKSLYLVMGGLQLNFPRTLQLLLPSSLKEVLNQVSLHIQIVVH